MNYVRRRTLIIVLTAVFIIGGTLFVFKDKIENLFREPLPLVQPYQQKTPPSSQPKQNQLPIEVNLDVPFTSQAPFQNWDLPYGEFCEEASVLMAASYINGWLIPNPSTANQKMLEIKAFEEKRFGYYEDTNAEETAIILKEFYGLKNVKILPNPQIIDIKTALGQGKLVIVPAAGRELGNPHFRNPGPLYHMLVIKGYTKNGDFITNDPGTRLGANYIYSQNVIMNAMHDWYNGNSQGRKVVIIVG